MRGCDPTCCQTYCLCFHAVLCGRTCTCLRVVGSVWRNPVPCCQTVLTFGPVVALPGMKRCRPVPAVRGTEVRSSDIGSYSSLLCYLTIGKPRSQTAFGSLRSYEWFWHILLVFAQSQLETLRSYLKISSVQRWGINRPWHVVCMLRGIRLQENVFIADPQ